MVSRCRLISAGQGASQPGAVILTAPSASLKSADVSLIGREKFPASCSRRSSAARCTCRRRGHFAPMRALGGLRFPPKFPDVFPVSRETHPDLLALENGARQMVPKPLSGAKKRRRSDEFEGVCARRVGLLAGATRRPRLAGGGGGGANSHPTTFLRLFCPSSCNYCVLLLGICAELVLGAWCRCPFGRA